jgi:hypothetical protein
MENKNTDSKWFTNSENLENQRMETTKSFTELHSVKTENKRKFSCCQKNTTELLKCDFCSENVCILCITNNYSIGRSEFLCQQCAQTQKKEFLFSKECFELINEGITFCDCGRKIFFLKEDLMFVGEKTCCGECFCERDVNPKKKLKK